MELERACTEYLRSVNPIAQRIAEDLENIHNANHETWNELDDNARKKIINENLIDTQLVFKYQDEVREDPDLEPLSNFSWFTKSQLDLFTLIDVKPALIKTPVKKVEVLSPLKRGKDTVDNKDLGIVNRIKLKVMKSPPIDEHKNDTKQHSKTLPKPRMPPPPPPPKRMNSENSALLSGSTSQDDIPKTGFDFLDNW
uniref:DUF4706 domain-containing protein n=1 Tax=Lygus hesperus TaxID=30085 RepID=A0A146KQP5_LYGHE